MQTEQGLGFRETAETASEPARRNTGRTAGKAAGGEASASFLSHALTRRAALESLVGCALLSAAGPLTLAAEATTPDQAPATPKKKPDARIEPVVQDVEGWKVHVDPQLREEGDRGRAGARALAMLANHLQRIAILVPAEPLAKLRKVELWIERRHPTLHAMQYHPSVEWLKSHGHDPRLAKKVHITRADELLSRQQMLKHPAVVLHELAHAYHDQVLDFDEPRIVKAYNKAKEAGSYEKVLLYTGQKVRHYALTDHKEYFAEGTEAYFYRNDFYPFVAAELKEHDPTLYGLLADIWGPLA
jgi:hypothetical protein